MKRYVALTLFLLTSAATVARADVLTQLDANEDGKVSAEEAAQDAALAAKFEELDTNKDGFLSADELSDR
ncbi:hypothetical protein LJ739_04720 [Aestuariibacter halophilus]|uniref:EF-hand domain-containing protein n=1 Tax=Fluctibacter halophilus TaxID=226011 RepID=A0ABS8G4S9_9ALTE|nr:hypothetical protein [Aestuariibacter halophilus]MCC2615538.1 hypothetical protein [Aestuariibacter halophilus]